MFSPKNAEKNTEHKPKPLWRDLLEAIIIAVILAFVIRTFFFGMYWVPSESMMPTIAVDDRLLVTKFSYWFEAPQRGQVVVFHSEQNDDKNMVKRLIGLPGETIEFRNNQLLVDGIVVDEFYLSADTYSMDYGPITVPEGEYFVCGDNRMHSLDSRFWGFVDKEEIIGRTMAIYWPLAHIKRL